MDEGHKGSQMNGKQAKRQWTRQEDAKLVECLVELAATSWKCDNETFKSGYAKQLEKMLNERLPACGLKANPHIESRVKMLKKQYCAIVEMMGVSGFGWNDKDKMIMVDKEIYNEWIKGHPNAKGLYNRLFLHLEELTGVFGKDRAQGVNAEDPAQATAAMEVELETDVNENIVPSLDDIEDELAADSQVPQTPICAGSSSTQSKKRKRINQGPNADILDSMHEMVVGIKNSYDRQTESTNEQTKILREMVSCFKSDKNASEQRVKLFQLLNDVPGLTNEDKNTAFIIFGTNPMLGEIIFSLPPEGLFSFVKTVLSTRSG